MSGLLGACMVGVALYCCARLGLPALRVEGHGRGLEVWHLLMVSAMAAMLVAAPLDHAGVGLAIFAVGLGWSLFQVARRHLRAAHLRLAVACAAMVAMLLPAAPVAAAPAGGAQMNLSMDMSMDMDMPMGAHPTGASGGHSMAALPTSVTVLLLAALGVVLVASVLRLARGKGPLSDRVDASCEGLMTVAMGYMLLSLG